MFQKMVFVLGVILSACHGYAQTWSDQEHGVSIAKMDFKAKRVVPPAPEAASLGQFGNVPVSLFTGTPKVSVPLYDLKGSSTGISIGMNYNATGFKPEDIATWVGLGWSLNAGGVITRSVMGNPDNASNYFNATNNYTNLPPVNDLYANYDYMTSIQQGVKEAQPDMYYYNFAGHSGKFLIKPDQTVFKKEKDNLKITHCITCVVASNTNVFTIVDESGVTYEFKDVEVSNMTLDDAVADFPQPLSYSYPSSWYLTKITSADGTEQINFSYYSTTTNHTLFRSFLPNGSMTYSYTTPGGSSWVGSSNSSGLAPMVTVNRKYLQSVSLVKNGINVGYVNFESVTDQRLDLADIDFPGERLLQSIKAYSRNTTATYTLVKQFNFNYSYFTAGPAGDKRLRLDNIQEMPVDGVTAAKPAYVFEYNTGVVPSYTGASVDHWGYYNGADGTTTLVPTINLNGQNFGAGANREPDLLASSTATLIKIKYPTGGYATFEYELNQARDINSNNAVRPVGGLRVKQIIDYSFTNSKAVVKNYQYTLNDGTISGQASFPTYTSTSAFHVYALPGFNGMGGTPAYDVSYITVTASSSFGLGSVQGSHVGYSQVTEFQSDASNNQPLGKTVYNYNIAAFNANDDNIANGDLLKQSVYDNGGKVLYEQQNTYNYSNLGGISSYKIQAAAQQTNYYIICRYLINGSPVYEWKSVAFTNPVCIDSRFYKSKLVYNGYATNYQYKQLTQQTEKKYDQSSNSYITSTKNFFYGNTAHTLATSIQQTTSNNELVITDKKYPLDYTVPASGLDIPTTGIKMLQDKNIIGAEIESVQYRQNSDGTNKRYITGILTTYENSFPVPTNLYRLETIQPLTSFLLSSTNGTFSKNANYKLLGTFKYDNYVNLSQQSKVQDLAKAYVWDYNFTLPTAEVINAEAESVAYSSFETENTGSWNSISNLSTNRLTGGITGKYSYNLASSNSIIKNFLLTTRQYLVSYWSKNGAITVTANNGGASAITGISRNGWTYYEHILPVGASSVTLTAAAANIDELRLYPKDAQMATTVYDLLNGAVTSQCSPNNMISYFEYDGYYRLVNIKDDDGNIVKNYKYNYGLGTPLTLSAQTLFYNVQKQGTFTRNTCPAGAEASVITYTVPYGRYASAISQLDADTKAQNDVNNNGQAYANTNGQCLYWNTAQSAYFSKNDCLPENGTSVCTTSGPLSQRWRILYTVPAHTYSSTVDQATANNLALAVVSANGQAYANGMCWCSCGGVGQKIVNSVCETGVRINSSTLLMSNGTWQCTYYYQFSDNSVSPFYTEYNSTPCQIL